MNKMLCLLMIVTLGISQELEGTRVKPAVWPRKAMLNLMTYNFLPISGTNPALNLFQVTDIATSITQYNFYGNETNNEGTLFEPFVYYPGGLTNNLTGIFTYGLTQTFITINSTSYLSVQVVNKTNTNQQTFYCFELDGFYITPPWFLRDNCIYNSTKVPINVVGTINYFDVPHSNQWTCPFIGYNLTVWTDKTTGKLLRNYQPPAFGEPGNLNIYYEFYNVSDVIPLEGGNFFKNNILPLDKYLNCPSSVSKRNIDEIVMPPSFYRSSLFSRKQIV